MAGNKAGGLKTVAIVKAKYGDDWYRHIGKKGGSAKGTGRAKGFAAHPGLARIVGKKGGLRLQQMKREARQ